MIERLLQRVSIRTKLVAMLMLISTAVLLIASSSFVAWDYTQFRTDLQSDLSVQARMVLENATAAMSFQDREAAQETLATLAPNRHIRVACLYDPSKALFAEFRPPDSSARCPASVPAEGYAFTAEGLRLTQSTARSGRSSGWVHLLSDLESLADRVQVLAGAMLFVLVIAIAIAFSLSTSLQRFVSAPIAELARTARAVSLEGDYSLRAHKTTSDELGLLVDSFNAMLDQIQRSEAERGELLRREREANRLKDEFLMTLSHELRTPLNAILGWTRMLTAEVLPQEARERALKKIERNARAQSRLVEDLLEVSRFTSGKFRLEKRPVDLLALTTNAIETVRPDADARQIRIELDTGAATLPTVGDPDRLQQVIWNLLSNAVKFSPLAGRVMVKLRRDASVDELVVSDSGAGIEPQFLPHVFDPFRQADASSTRLHGGLGLGLSIARRITQMHGGELTAASKGRGLGATFTVTLPVAQADLRAYQSRPAPPPVLTDTDLAGVAILVVDDDKDTRDILTSALGAAGAAVQVAASAAEALRLATAQRPEILVSDLAMPGQDGYELIARLRQVLGSHQPRVAIALTALAAEHDRQRALSVGFHRLLTKPADPIALIEVLKELMALAES